jgi:hypothetical protein
VAGACTYRTFTQDGAKEVLLVTVEYVDCDGKGFGVREGQFEIKEFDNTKYMNQLPIFPLKYHTEGETALQVLLERGRKFVALKGQHFKALRGVTRKIGGGGGLLTVRLDPYGVFAIWKLTKSALGKLSSCH